ncbi:MAG: HAMP domain-containing histidine kinase, partial [Oscillospiraceae bacterium]|nr:HAMP domain-containing histidine kinase [Oscillospiraceae bacterium]
MKGKTISFRGRLWSCFAGLTVCILGMLWLLQTVFLRSSYRSMVESNVRSVAASIQAHAGADEFEAWLDATAAGNSLLIFITDEQGQALYATDEHNGVYTVQATEAPDTVTSNPYRQNQGEMSWQRGQAHYLSLPSGYNTFLQALQESNEDAVCYESSDGTALIYGFRMTANGQNQIVYLSTTLGAVGSTVRIIRTQLLWVTAISLVLAFGLAWLLARRFSAPISRIASEARHLAQGQFGGEGAKGFSSEMDTLSDALEQAASDITEARTYQKDFLANISHDLRTPLTMIKGYAEMVRDISWRDEEKRESDLGVIIREADRLTALVNDIVDFEGMESGKTQMTMTRFSISEMAQSVIGQFSSLCQREGYTIHAEIMPDLIVNGDEKQLSRVLYNLIDNALTHTGDDKTVLVAVRQHGDSIHIEVEDHGHGIPAEVLPHVWDRYFRAAQRKRNKKGSGLGLA